MRKGHALSIGRTPYDGKVDYGVDADYDAVPDARGDRQCIVDALEELVESVSTGRTRAPRERDVSPRTSRPRVDTSRKKDG